MEALVANQNGPALLTFNTKAAERALLEKQIAVKVVKSVLAYT